MACSRHHDQAWVPTWSNDLSRVSYLLAPRGPSVKRAIQHGLGNWWPSGMEVRVLSRAVRRTAVKSPESGSHRLG